MTLPLMVLAALSTVGGVALAWKHTLAHWLAPIYPPIEGKETGFEIANETMLMGVAVVVAALGTWMAYQRFYKRGLAADEAFAASAPGLARALEHKWYVDELYEVIIVRPLETLSMFFWRGIDVTIDGVLSLGAYLVALLGDLLRFFQTGNVRNYALMFFVGVIVFVWVFA